MAINEGADSSTVNLAAVHQHFLAKTCPAIAMIVCSICYADALEARPEDLIALASSF